MTSKYEPLAELFRSYGKEKPLPLKFGQIERILGFPLPDSARKHRGWWANEPRSHVQARAWINAGWKTWEVWLEKEEVLFRRHDDDGKGKGIADPESIQLDLRTLPFGISRLLRDYAAENGGDFGAAVSRALQDAVFARRNRLIDRIRANAPVVPDDSVDLIREDRDAR